MHLAKASSVIMLMLSVAFLHYNAERCYAECRYAECPASIFYPFPRNNKLSQSFINPAVSKVT